MTLHPLTAYRERQQPRLTLEELGARVGVSKPTIWRIEAGQQQPSPDLARALERETGIPRHKLRPDLWDAPAPERAAS
jgi:transcriptional regulator with XRE-family HTH domain